MKTQDNWMHRLLMLTVLLLVCTMAFVSCDGEDTPPVHEHTIVIDDAVPPTCTNTGLTEGKHCSVCNEVLVAQQTIPATGHVYDNEQDSSCIVCGCIRNVACAHTNTTKLSAVNATCTKNGLTEGTTCADCGEVLVAQQTIPATGHTEVIDAAQAPICTTNGLTEGKHCSVCHAGLIPQQTIPATGHVYDDKYDEACNVCGHTRDAECAHANTTTLPATAATCTQAGLTEGKQCAKCGEIIVAQQTIPAKGHTEVIDKAKDSTCTETGLSQGKHCSVCNEVLVAQQTIPANGHAEVIDAAQAPTCTTNGLTEGKHCSVCHAGLIPQQTIPATGHVYDDKYDEACNVCGHTRDAECAHTNTITLPPLDATCTETGLTEGKQCAKCGGIIVFQQTIPATGHTEVIDAVKIPTCTVTGLTEGKHCSICNEIFVAQHPINAFGHKFTKQTISSDYLKKDASCTEPAEYYYCCSRCELSSKGQPEESTFIISEFKLHTYEDEHDTICNVCGFDKSNKVAGLYDANDHLIATWETLGINIKKNYTYSDYKTSKTSPYYVLTYNSAYSAGQELVIPNSVTSIGSFAFRDCSSLTSIVIPDSVTSIGGFAFYDCSSLTSIEIPDSVTSIDDYAFYGCSSLTSVKLPDSVTSIGSCAFRYCSSLTSIDIPDSVTSIGDYAFYYCRSLTSIEIPDSVTSIGEYAFQYCSSLTSIVIPNRVTSIGEWAFSDCSSLTSVVIGNSVTSIGERAFYGCSSLTSVYITDIEAWLKIYFAVDYSGGGLNENSIGFSNPCCYGADLYLNNEKLTELVVPDSFTSIPSYVFYGCTSLTNVVIPDSVTSINSYAFYGCTGMTSITIPNSIVSISGAAFRDCSSLKSVYITDIEAWLRIRFYYYYEDRSIYSHSNPCCYGADLYLNNEKLTVLVIPDFRSSISDYAFNGCRSITSIVIPDSVTSIGRSAFEYCSSLTSIIFAGTKAQWDAISKDFYWNTSTGNYTVYCTDGTITKNGVVTYY